MRLGVGRVDHYDPGLLRFGSQFGHDRGEHAHPAPPLPAVVERLRRAIGRRRVLPHQPIALDEDYPAQHPPVIDPRPASGLRKERAQPLYLRICQPVKLAQDPSPSREFESCPRRRSSKFIGPDSSRLPKKVFGWNDF